MLNVENRTPYPGKEGRVRLRQDNGQVIEGVLEMDDDATAPGTPWNRQSGRLLQADIRSYPVAEGQTIAAGDVVDVVDGNITRTMKPQPNVEKVFFTNGRVTGLATCNPTNDTLFVHIQYSYSAIRYYSISDGELTQISSGMATEYSDITYIDCCALSASKFITSYVRGGILRHKVVVPSGASFDLGLEEQISTSPTTYNRVITLSDSSYLSVYNYRGLKAKICTVSGTSISSSSEFSLSGSTSATYISATRLPDSGTTRRVCVCYRDDRDSYKGKAVIVSVDSDNSVSFGNPVVFDTDYSGNIRCKSNAENVAIVYSATSSNYGRIRFIDCSSDSISVPSNFYEFYSNRSVSGDSCGVEWVNENTIFSVLSYASPSVCECYLISVSTGTLSLITTYQLSKAKQYMSTSVLNQNHFILSYADNSNSYYGTATILTVSGNQIAGSFLDGSKDSIALQSGASGQSIEVIYSGTVAADWVTEGQSIESDGVYGAGVLDGVLQVWSKDRPGTKIETGSYTGTGKNGSSNPNSLSFNGEPLIVIISADSGSRIGVFINGSNDGPVLTGNSNYINTLSWGTRSVSWYTDSGAGASAQLNESGAIYNYIAFLRG